MLVSGRNNVKEILKSDEYIDYIMPQIYFGFNNKSRPFIDTVNDWIDMIENKNNNHLGDEGLDLELLNEAEKDTSKDLPVEENKSEEKKDEEEEKKKKEEPASN